MAGPLDQSGPGHLGIKCQKSVRFRPSIQSGKNLSGLLRPSFKSALIQSSSPGRCEFRPIPSLAPWQPWMTYENICSHYKDVFLSYVDPAFQHSEARMANGYSKPIVGLTNIGSYSALATEHLSHFLHHLSTSVVIPSQ